MHQKNIIRLYRPQYSISKDHCFGATCISAAYFDLNTINLDYHAFEIKQFRNNRQTNNRKSEHKYYLGKKKYVATNKRPRYD